MSNYNFINLSEENIYKEKITEIYSKCIYKFYCHTLSDDKIFRCSPIVNLEKYIRKHKNIEFDNTCDYLKIKNSSRFKDDLFNYLDSKSPLKGCAYCLGSSGKPFSHRQLTAEEVNHPEKVEISSKNYNFF